MIFTECPRTSSGHHKDKTVVASVGCDDQETYLTWRIHVIFAFLHEQQDFDENDIPLA